MDDQEIQFRYASAAEIYAAQVVGPAVAEKLRFYAERDGLDIADLARRVARMQSRARKDLHLFHQWRAGQKETL